MTTEAKQQTRILVQAAAAACVDKKGEETRILELDPADSGLSDFFLVTSAANDRQAIAIADEIEHRLKKEFGVFPNSVEGRRKGDWVLLDYVDFVVHVFLAERRAFYDIERLRKSARPLTPAEFDAELKAELAAKTVAVRKKATAKAKPVAAEVVPTAAKIVPAAKTPQSIAKPQVAPSRVAAKAMPALKPKTAAKKVVAKKALKNSLPAKKAVAANAKAKPVAKKSVPAPKPKVASKKVAPKKIVVKKAVAKKTAKKVSPAKKPVAVKAKATKPAAKKSAVKKIAAKKAPAKKSVAKKKK
jgi:ribosome-associated protein